MKRLLVLSAVLALGSSSVAWSQAQTPRLPVAPNPANFTGTVTPHATDDIRMTRYSFEPGARSNWHSHEGGQVLVVERGRMRVQERGSGGREFGPRQTYVVAPGVVHWHGAVPNETLTQVALSYGVTTWLDRVSDAEYTAAGTR
jgi:quercetin dioxygenase-like cupin family protein